MDAPGQRWLTPAPFAGTGRVLGVPVPLETPSVAAVPRLGTTVAVIALFTAILFGWNVGDRGLWSAHEGRAAQNAASMVENHRWLLPELTTGEMDHQKPPLYYWLVGLLSELNGQSVTALTVRAPSTLSAIAGIILVYLFGRRLWGHEAGLLAATILATTTRYAWLARVGRIDMPLTVVVLGALFLFYRSTEDAASRVSRWFYVLVGAGVMFKGPVALLLTFLPIGCYLLLAGDPVVPLIQRGWLATWHRLRLLAGIPIVLTITVPWFAYAVHSSGGEFFWDFFVYHNIDRALGTQDALKSGPLWFYLPRLLVDCFPWSLLFPAVFATFWHERRQFFQIDEPHRRHHLFLVAWIVSQFLFVSIVSFKRPDYLLPIFPPLALLMAGWLDDRFARFTFRQIHGPVRNPIRRLRVLQVTAYLLATVSAAMLLWAARQFVKKGVVKAIFEIDLMEKHLNVTDHFMMKHVESLLRTNWPLLAIGLVVVVGCVWLFHTAWHSRSNRRIVAALALPWLVCYLFQIQVLLPALDPLRDMSRFGEDIRGLASDEKTIYYFGKFDADLVFHAGRPARCLEGSADLDRLAHTERPAYVVMKRSMYQAMKQDSPLAQWTVIADNHATAFGEHRNPRVMVTNQPLAVADRFRPARERRPNVR